MEDAGTLGMLLALAVGTVKLLEKIAEWAIAKVQKRNGKGSNGHSNGHSAELDPKVQQAIKEIHDVVHLRDGDGVPLVYWPRSQIETQKEMAETLRDISRSQDRMVDKLETIADNTRK